MQFVGMVKEFESSKNLPEHTEFVPSYFDPNQLGKEGFLVMGLNEKLASNIMNYRAAGGKFRSKDDLKKIYGMTDSLFQIIEDYIIIQAEEDKSGTANENESPVTILFPFDPNSIDDDSWKKLGFSDFKILNIKNYQKAGGKFRIKEDLKKLYTVTNEDYDRVKDFILLPDSLTVQALNDNKLVFSDKSNVVVEINSADTAQLSQLKGIGAAISQRIVKYRDKLGGFFRKEQLLEVFGIDTTRFKGFENQILVDVSLIRKMELNKTDFKEMTKHPYLEYHIVKSIFTYKDNKGSFSSVDDLQKVDLVYDQLYQKIRWYFYVNEKRK